MAEAWCVQCTVEANLRLPEGVPWVEVGSEGAAAGDTTEVSLVVLNLKEPGQFEARIELQAANEELAQDLGRRWAGDLASILSFLTGLGTEVKGVTITTAPQEPTPGTKYRSIIPADYVGAVGPPELLLPEELTFLIRERPERLKRALGWLHKSRLAHDIVDEFVSLLVAFESMSGLLKEGGRRFWHCESCGRDVSRCPECGQSTESRMSGADALREFTTAQMGWSPREWGNVWKLRNKLLHGEADVSLEERRELLPSLVPRLEHAVVASIKMLSGLEPGHAPRRLRPRLPFSDPVLHVEWAARPNGDPVRGQNSGDAHR
jgi:hypothetical protein